MKYIGKRISLLEKDNEWSVVILGTDNKTKRLIMLLWLITWTICGLIIIGSFFTMIDSNTKPAVVVWLFFWAYFEYKVLTAFLWRKFGKEKTWFKEGKLFIKRDINGRGKTDVYETDFIKNLRLTEGGTNHFVKVINQSYWVIAGERIAFDYYGKEIRLGIQLNDHDAENLLKVMSKKLA